MLVLSRKRNESIVVNGNITIKVVEIRGDQVRFGIVAPPEVPVNRLEVQERIDSGNTQVPAPVKPTRRRKGGRS